MRKILHTVFLLIYSGFLFSQDVKPEPEVFAVCLNGKWGAQDKSGKPVIEKTYDHVSIDKYNHILVGQNGLFGILNKVGNSILPIQFSSIKASSDALFITEKDGKFGIFHNSPGNFLFNNKYNEIKHKGKGFFILKTDSSYFLYDHSKKFITKAYKNIRKTSDTNTVFILKKDDKEQLFVGSKNYMSADYDTIITARHNLYFLKDHTKKKVSAVFDKVYLFETDSFCYKEFVNDILFIRSTGKMRALGADTDKSYNIDHVSSVFSFERKKKYRTSIGDFLDTEKPEKFAYIYLKGKTGIINEELKIIIKPEYDKIEKFGLRFFKIEKDNKKGYASKKGEILVPCFYNKIRYLNPYFFVSNEKGEGVYSLESGKIIENKYDKIKHIAFDYFSYVSDNKKGIIRSGNIELTSAQYSTINLATNGFIVSEIVSGKMKFGFINKSGDIIIASEYDEIKEIKPGIFKVGVKENNKLKYGLFNDKGKQYIPFSYRNIKPTDNENIYQISGFKSVVISIRNLNFIRGLELPVPRHDRNRKYFPAGYVNTSAEILLDTLYLPPQIFKDFRNNVIQVMYQYGVQLITFENNGKLYDKTEYSNFIKVYESVVDKEFTWKQKDTEGMKLWGLYWNQFKVLNHEFDRIIRSGFGENYNAVIAYNKIGLVNMKTGKLIAEPVYLNINRSDLESFKYIVANNAYGRTDFLDENYCVKRKGFGFIGDISKSYVRVNKGGKTEDVNEKKLAQYIKNLLSEYQYKTCTGGKWGVMNSNAVYTVQPQYDFMREFLHGGFIVKSKDKWGKIDSFNDVIIDYIYDDIQFFTKRKIPPIKSIINYTHLIKQEIPYYKAKMNGKWGVIDSVGNVIVPFKYNDILCEHDSISTIFISVTSSADNFYGYVDEAGKMRSVPRFIKAEEFKNGFAKVQKNKNEWLFIDTAMNVLACGPFSESNNFSGGFAAVKMKSRWGYIDKKGKFIIEPQFNKAGDFSEALAPVYRSLKHTVLENKKRTSAYVFIDKDNQIIIRKYFDYCSSFYNNASIVRIKDKYGLINRKGRFILPIKYDKIVLCDKSGVFKVTKNKQLFLYNSEGDKIYHLKKSFSKCTFNEGLCAIRSGNKYIFIDREGTVILSVKAKHAGSFKYDRALIYDNSVYSYINKNGQVIFSFNENEKNKNIFLDENVSFINPKSQVGKNLFAMSGDQFGDHTPENKFLCNEKSVKKVILGVSEIKEFSEGFAAFGVKNLYGIYDVDGHQSATDQYLKIEKILPGLYKLSSLNEIKYIKQEK